MNRADVQLRASEHGGNELELGLEMLDVFSNLNALLYTSAAVLPERHIYPTSCLISIRAEKPAPAWWFIISALISESVSMPKQDKFSFGLGRGSHDSSHVCNFLNKWIAFF